MKITYLLCCLLLLCTVNAQTLTIGSYNLRYDNPRDSGNLWINRAPVVANQVRFHGFDVFGTQEGLRHQLDKIVELLPAYRFSGIGRDDGQATGEYSAIFYKKEKFELLKSGDFWLSQTPEKPGWGWDAKLNRICSWVLLKEKQSGKKFYFFNVHYDHQAMVARRESSKLILQKTKEIAGNEPLILTGDFNGNHQSEWYKAIATSGYLTDSYGLVPYPYINNGSFNGFGKNLNSRDIIDHIFLTRDFEVNRWGVLTDSYDGKFPSDHFPVLAEVSFKKGKK